MANPLYGQNKQDDMLDALASADENIEDAGTGTSSAGESAHADADSVIPVTINGTVYYIPLYASND